MVGRCKGTVVRWLLTRFFNSSSKVKKMFCIKSELRVIYVCGVSVSNLIWNIEGVLNGRDRGERGRKWGQVDVRN